MNVTILAANGQIAHLVEERLLTEPTFKDIQLTLMLRHPERLSELNDNPRVTLLDGDLTNPTDVIQATKDADLIWSAVVDHDQFVGVSGSRRSIADVVCRIIADPSLGANDSLGIGDPTTEGATRPVY